MDKLISPNQSVFIKGRQLVVGLWQLMRSLTLLKNRETNVLFLKWILRRHMTWLAGASWIV
jgi:hypothetical protein